MSDCPKDSVTIHNTRLDQNFTSVINSTWADENISFKAKGILIYILTRPPNWIIHPWQLAEIYKGEGKGNGIEAVRAAIKELRDAGYLIYSKFRNEKGHWQHRYDAFPMPYVIFKKMFPQLDKPDMDKRNTDKPDTDNADILIKNELTKNELTKNEIQRSKDHIARPAEERPHYEITFSFEKSKFEGIEKNDLNSWKELYPAVEIVTELKRMREWIISNQSKTKSKKKWRQFINNWLRKTNDETLNKEAYRGSKEKPKEKDNLGKTKIKFKPNGEMYEE